jgi:adenylate kinase family enzyme
MNKNNIPLAFVLGPTNAGKTTLLDHLRKDDNNGIVEVGKLMRAKYPPYYFKGSGAPAHTQTEALQMCMDGIENAANQGKLCVFIDGQPRNIEQFHILNALPNPKHYVFLWAPVEDRMQRAVARDGNDPEKLKLSLDRIVGDGQSLFDVLVNIIITKANMSVVPTNTNSDQAQVVSAIISRAILNKPHA